VGSFTEFKLMQKLISDLSINHTIDENHSVSIKQFPTYTGNFSFKINFSFLNQSLQGNLHKFLKQPLHSYQNHLPLSYTACTQKKDSSCTATVQIHTTVWIYCADPYHCTDLLYHCLFNLLKTCKSILILLCAAFSPLVIQPAQLFNCKEYLSILSYLCFLKP